MSGMWKRSHGRTSEAPPDERGGYRYVRPTATAPHLDSTLDAHNAEANGLPVQSSFVVADGGQIPWSTDIAALQRQIRFAITRGKEPGAMAELIISTSAAFES